MMDINEIPEYLKKYGIRKTTFRIELLEVFQKSKHSLSHQEIKDQIKTTQDKVTIYRALDTFLEKGLIHKVPDSKNISKYALCPQKCAESGHQHNHSHFICNSCDNTFCMDEVKAPVIKDIKGFKVKSTKIILEGECPDCLSNKQ